jgi:hypothetical protein
MGYVMRLGEMWSYKLKLVIMQILFRLLLEDESLGDAIVTI